MSAISSGTEQCVIAAAVWRSRESGERGISEMGLL